MYLELLEKEISDIFSSKDFSSKEKKRIYELTNESFWKWKFTIDKKKKTSLVFSNDVFLYYLLDFSVLFSVLLLLFSSLEVFFITLKSYPSFL